MLPGPAASWAEKDPSAPTGIHVWVPHSIAASRTQSFAAVRAAAGTAPGTPLIATVPSGRRAVTVILATTGARSRFSYWKLCCGFTSTHCLVRSGTEEARLIGAVGVGVGVGDGVRVAVGVGDGVGDAVGCGTAVGVALGVARVVAVAAGVGGAVGVGGGTACVGGAVVGEGAGVAVATAGVVAVGAGAAVGAATVGTGPPAPLHATNTSTAAARRIGGGCIYKAVA